MMAGKSVECYQQVEQRYGFALPADYRAMRKRRWLDFDPAVDGAVAFNPAGHRYLWLNEMEWLSLEAIRDFEFPSYCLSGFVPFAFTGGGDHWCWYPRFMTGGVTPVVLCPRDTSTARFYAPHFLASLYRQTLDYALGWFDPDEEDVARSHLNRWAADLGPLMPELWRQTLTRLRDAPMQTWQHGTRTARALLRDEEYEVIIRRDLAFPQLNEEFQWMYE